MGAGCCWGGYCLLISFGLCTGISPHWHHWCLVDDILGSFNHPLQSSPVLGHAHSIHICDVSSLDAFYCSSVKVNKNLAQSKSNIQLPSSNLPELSQMPLLIDFWMAAPLISHWEVKGGFHDHSAHWSSSGLGNSIMVDAVRPLFFGWGFLWWSLESFWPPRSTPSRVAARRFFNLVQGGRRVIDYSFECWALAAESDWNASSSSNAYKGLSDVIKNELVVRNPPADPHCHGHPHSSKNISRNGGELQNLALAMQLGIL